MKCNNCGTENDINSSFCINCGQKIVKEKPKKEIKIDYLLLVIIALLVILGSLIYLLLKPPRDKILSGDSNKGFTFTLEGEEFNVISKFDKYMEKGFYVLDENYYIKYDNITINNIYKDDKVIALAAFYCPNKEGCNYKDTSVVKLNPYKDIKLEIKDITSISSKEEVEKIYGNASGVLKADDKYYVWSFGHSVGRPYMIISFRGSKQSFIDSIKVGVWWYEEEYQHTVKGGTTNEE